MRLYHYTSIDDWEGIKNGSYVSKHTPGLGANRRLGKKYLEAFTRTAVFLLLDSEPESWVKNKHFQGIWDQLKRETGELLLEIEPENISQYSVLDWGHMEGHLSIHPEYLRRKGGNIPLRYLRESREEAEKAYIGSEVPLKKYSESKSLQNWYSIPEVITSENIPFSEISISKIQPKLIDRNGTPLDNHAKNQIERIPELKVFL